MTDREKAGQPPRFSWGGALCRRMFAVRFQAATVTLSSVLSEAATIAPCEVWVGLALLAAMVLPLKT